MLGTLYLITYFSTTMSCNYNFDCEGVCQRLRLKGKVGVSYVARVNGSL